MIWNCVEKGLKLKFRKCCGKLAVTFLHFSPPPILNRVESELTDSRPVKTITKKKYRLQFFIDCSVEVTCIVTVIILENMFANINLAVFNYRRIGEGQMFCWGCMFVDAQYQPPWDVYLFIYLLYFTSLKVGTILVITAKNQPTNQKYVHTYIE